MKELKTKDSELEKLIKERDEKMKKKVNKTTGAVFIQFETLEAKEYFENELKKNKEKARIEGVKKLFVTQPDDPVNLNWRMYDPGASEPKCKRFFLWIIILILIFIRNFDI